MMVCVCRLLAFLVLISSCKSEENQSVKDFPSPQDNPATQAGIELGKALFFSKQLSKNKQTSCASCHKPDSGFASGGFSSVNDKPGLDASLRDKRNIPSLYNLAWSSHFFWDGRAKSLESLMFLPIVNTGEMNGNLKKIVSYLNTRQEWRAKFKQAFGSDTVYSALIGKALAQYVRSLTKEIPQDLPPSALKGLQLFKEHCQSCHSGPQTSDFRLRTMAIAPQKNKITGNMPSEPVLDLSALKNQKFKTPGLANIRLTPPYMHDGSYATLEEVVAGYAQSLKKEELRNPENQADLVQFLKNL